MVNKAKSSLKVENKCLIAKYAWKGVNKVLNISIFKTSLKGKVGDKKPPSVKKTYGMLLESAGNSTIKIGKDFSKHFLKHDFINRINGEYNRLIQNEKKKIKDEDKKSLRIKEIEDDRSYVLNRLKEIDFEKKINNLNNWLDRKCPDKKFIDKKGKNYQLLIYKVIGPKDKIRLFCSKYYQPAFRNFIIIETQVKKEIDVQMIKDLFKPSQEEQDRIRKVYVKPREYDKALEFLKKEKLLLIHGIKEIGKTAMAHYLSFELEEKGSRKIWWVDEFSKTENLRILQDATNEVIVLNDVFGKAKLLTDTDESIKHLIDYLRERNNYIIMTSRDSTLKELNKILPALYKDFLSDYEFELNSSSYTDIDLRKILDNHIQYVRRRFDEDLKLVEKDKLEIIRSIRLPLHIFILTTRKLKLVRDGKITLKNAIKESKKLRKITRNWYLNIERPEDLEFVRLIALFPGMPKQDFRRIYEKITGKSLEYYHIRNLRERFCEYVQTEGNIDFIHPDCFEGIWDEILSEGKESFLEIIPKLLELVEDMSLRLQTSYCLKEIGVREPELVLSEIKIRLAEDELYRKHMMAHVSGELGKVIGIREPLSTIIKDMIKPEKLNDMIEGVHILKKIAKKKKEEVYRFLAEDFIKEVGKGRVLNVVNILGDSRADIKTTIELLEGMKKYFPDSNLIEIIDKNLNKLNQKQDINKDLPKEKNLVKNPSFKEGLKYWYSTAEESISFKQESVNGKNHCHGIEKRKDNLGRLYQDLTPLLNKGILVPGRKYNLSAFIRTKDVESVESYRPGAVIGVSYVDEEGWTPRIDAFQCEIGMVLGTQEKHDENKFVLRSMPPESTSLWVYFDFNGGNGEAWFTDIILEEE
jgi:hypothetical protein